MFEKPDLLLDVYRPFLRAAFFAGHHARKVPGFDGLFTRLIHRRSSSPAGLSEVDLSGVDGDADGPINIDATLEKIIGPGGCPGIAALALRGDRIIAQGVAGLRKKGASERINLGDRFHLGSCTKAMNATLVAMLIEAGKLSWTTTLGEIFGGMVTDMHPAWKSVTLPQILAHRGGVIRDTDRGLRAKLVSSGLPLPRQRRVVVINVLSNRPTYRPGTKMVYSNAGYVLVGAALEHITGVDWHELVTERLFKPLGITTAGFGVPGTPGKIDQPWGHFPVIGRPVDPGSPAAEAPMFDVPAGLIHTTMADWAKFIAMHLCGNAANPNRQATLLQPETIEKLHTPAPGEGYCFGWVLETKEWARGAQPRATGRVLSHGGTNFRWHCRVSLAPEINFAVLTACNRGIDLTAIKVCERAADALIRAFALKPAAGR